MTQNSRFVPEVSYATQELSGFYLLSKVSGRKPLQYSRGRVDKIGRFGIGRRYWESHFNE
jgi:hypothetical protein